MGPPTTADSVPVTSKPFPLLGGCVVVSRAGRALRTHPPAPASSPARSLYAHSRVMRASPVRAPAFAGATDFWGRLGGAVEAPIDVLADKDQIEVEQIGVGGARDDEVA